MNSGKTVATGPTGFLAPTARNSRKAGVRILESGVGFSSTAFLFRRKTMQLASRFASHSPALRSDSPLSDDQIRRVAPSIFADAPHESRSERYSYIPTAAVLTELRKEGFQPFMEIGRASCRERV